MAWQVPVVLGAVLMTDVFLLGLCAAQLIHCMSLCRRVVLFVTACVGHFVRLAEVDAIPHTDHKRSSRDGALFCLAVSRSVVLVTYLLPAEGSSSHTPMATAQCCCCCC